MFVATSFFTSESERPVCFRQSNRNFLILTATINTTKFGKSWS